MHTFLTRRGAVQTREKLLEDVWNMDPNVNTRTVDKHVQRLRNKLLRHADYIQTVRGVGYRFFWINYKFQRCLTLSHGTYDVNLGREISQMASVNPYMLSSCCLVY